MSQTESIRRLVPTELQTPARAQWDACHRNQVFDLRSPERAISDVAEDKEAV
jgi:hypothetical protein